jgi:RimJ/RimL family protein N-acetyltransferase
MIRASIHEGATNMEVLGGQLFIRPWTRADDTIVDRWPPYNDPFESLWNIPRPFSFANSWSQGLDFVSSRRSWAVEHAGGVVIGRISLREIDERKGRARLGVTFGAPYIGQGLGTEALGLFLDHFFSTLGFESMVLDVAAPNVRAIRCYLRLGFSHIGSDWREVSASFDTRILAHPLYNNLAAHFQHHTRGLKVEFYEMQLHREAWLNHRYTTALLRAG